MINHSVVLDIFNYTGNKIVNLYDSSKQMSGEAVNIHKIEERNGWKELSFTLPCKCMEEDGEKENYRLQYLIADYKLRLIVDGETDWYIISEPKITHNNFSKTVDVVAGHVAQLLKTKKLSLEFSDTEGNNVGTAKELIECVLEGTDWHVGNVYEFVETFDTTQIKRRSLSAGAQTGAFKLIEMICELFDAKPVYHGEGTYEIDGVEYTGQVVDVLPMNPFSKDKLTNGIPDEVLSGDTKVFELHYDRNLQNVTRTLNTNNLITKLYAYGSYGDLSGLCSIQTCEHNEYTFEMTESITSGTEFYFTIDGANRYFTVTNNLSSGDKLIYSDLDFSSRSYIWDETNQYAYHLSNTPSTLSPVFLDECTVEKVQNLFPYLLNFTYYDEVGLLSESQFQQIAAFQRITPELYETCISAATNFADMLSSLSKIGNTNTGFLRFAASGYTVNQDNSTDITIDLTQGELGILYRSDYINNRKNLFAWHVASDLKSNGDPVTGTPSYVLIAHNTDPITWEKAYVKEIWAKDGSGDPYLITNSKGEPGDFYYSLEKETVNPCKLVLWYPMSSDNRNRPFPAYSQDDQFFLFCTNSQSGEICALEVQDEAIINSKIRTSLGSEFEDHPVYFMDGRTGMDTVPTTDVVSLENHFGWYYKYYVLEDRFGDLFFCGLQDTTWHPVTVADTPPSSPQAGDYFFDEVYRVLYAYLNGEWIKLETAEYQRIAQCFSQVFHWCHERDKLYKGIYDYYYHTVDGEETSETLTYLPVGRYAIDDGYDCYWVFTTRESISKNSIIKLDTQNKYIYQDDDVGHILSASVVDKYITERAVGNLISEKDFSEGLLDPSDGTEVTQNEFTKPYTGYRTRYIKVYPGETYNMVMPQAYQHDSHYIGAVYFYDSNNQYIDYITIDNSSLTPTGGSFMIPVSTGIDPSNPSYRPNVEKIRILWTNIPNSSPQLSVDNYQRKMYLNDNTHTLYTILDVTGHGDNLIGLNNLMARFVNTANSAYLYWLNQLETAQSDLNNLEVNLQESLGLMYREGYWKDDSYVSGDEVKLYNDAMDNLEEIGKPEATYNISFINQFGSDQNEGNSIDETSSVVHYQDVDITNAVHLVDPEIDVNCWAYLDKVDTCYDKSWETSIEINTRLSLIGQHDFTDVLSSIADVAKSTKAKQAVYDSSAQMNGLSTSDNSQSGLVQPGMIYIGTTTRNATIDGQSISNTNYRGVNSEDLDYGDVIIDATSSGQITLDGEPVESVIIRGNNVSGIILTGSNLAGMLSSGLVTEDTVAKRVRTELERIMQTVNLRFQNTISHWYTDEKTGAFIFENIAPNGRKISALKLGGDGLFGASELDPETQDYKWTPFMSGTGISAECITEGVLHASVIPKDSLTVDKLSSEVGQMLDISSNRGLNLFATTDGNKPTGSLKTSDAMIEIHSAIQGISDHAQINILSGGEINLTAGSSGQDNGTINIGANRSVNIMADAAINMYSGGTIDMFAGSDINIGAGEYGGENANINVHSTGSINLMSNGSLNLLAGVTRNDGRTYYDSSHNEVTISYDQNDQPIGVTYDSDGYAVYNNSTYTNEYLYYSYEYEGTTYYERVEGGRIVVNSANGIDIASNGSINIRTGGSFVVQSGNFSIDTSGNVTMQGSITATTGYIGGPNGWIIDTNIIKSGSGSSFTALSTSGNYRIWAGDETASSAPFSVQKNGKLMAKSGDIAGWSFNDKKFYNGSGSSYTALSIDGDYRIWAGNATASSAPFYVKKDGYLQASSGTVGGWTLGTDTISNGSGSSYTALSTNGDYRFWAGNATSSSAPFYVKKDGEIKASSGTVGGWTLGANTLSNGSGSSYTALSVNGNYRFWAGNETASNAPFYVKKDGEIKAESGKIGGWTIDGTKLKATDGDYTAYIDADGSKGSKFIWIRDTQQNVDIFRLDTSSIILPCSGRLGLWDLHSEAGYDDFYAEMATGSGNTKNRIQISTPLASSSSIVISVGTAAAESSRKFKVYADGDVVATGTFTSSSSKRIKHNIQDLTYNDNIIDKLNPVSFIYNRDKTNKTRYGLIYEDTVKLLPDICNVTDGEESINYIDIVPVLIKEVQKLRNRISVLEGE